MRGLAEDLPRLRDRLLETLDRIKDLHKTISKRYYHPGFHGSFSVKSVLPALLPEMGHVDLAIQDGQQAGLAYLKMLDSSTPGRVSSELPFLIFLRDSIRIGSPTRLMM